MVEFLTQQSAVLDVHSAPAAVGMMAKLRGLVAAGPDVVQAPGGDGRAPVRFRRRGTYSPA